MSSVDAKHSSTAIGPNETLATGRRASPVPTLGKVWTAVEKNDASELEKLLISLSSIKPGTVYDMVDSAWIPEKMDVALLLLNWGNTAHKFQVLKAAAAKLGDRSNKSKTADHNTEDNTEDNRERNVLEVEGKREREEDRRKAENICIYIIDKLPGVINHRPEGPLPTILHIAALARSDNLVRKIFESITDKAAFGALLKIKNDQAEGKTPLRVAVEAGLLCLVRGILEFNDSPINDKKLLDWVKDYDKREILMILAELRPGDMDEGVLNYAIDQKDQELFKALQDAEPCHRLFHRPGLLRDLIITGQVAMLSALLEDFPHLALQLDQEKKPLLAHNKDNKIRAKVVDRIIWKAFSADRSCYRSLLGYDDSQQAHNALIPPTSEVIRAFIVDPPETRKEISFSLGGFSTWTTSAESFLDLIPKSNIGPNSDDKPPNLLQVVNFETTLIYVDIPVPDLPRLQSDGTPIWIRSEVYSILEWLRQKKRVEGIYELCVRDSCYLPHTESVIRACIEGFDVEVLDWRRLDLSKAVLHAADNPNKLICRNLKMLRLYVGSSPALTYWMQDGLSFLSRFEKLEQVDIYVIDEFVGPNICSGYATEAQEWFDKKFKLAHPETRFRVVVTTESWAGLNPSETRPARNQEATAVEVTKLGNFLTAYESLQLSFADSVHWRPKRLKKEKNFPPVLFHDLNETTKRTPYIRIAVIDNGVDPGSIECRGISGASFVPTSKGESNWWHITHPHGTKMARIITQVNPYCSIFAAKVGEGRNDFNAGRMIKALDWAVAAGVDIISISLTLKDSSELEEAVNRAFMGGVIVIASVDGEGGNSQGDEYPARYPNVLGIGSANSKGEASSGTSEASANYLFPGEKLFAQTEYLGGLEDTPDISGPSVATAVAAGVASLVLACHRFALFQKPGFQRPPTEEQRPKKVVETVFNKMTSGSKYVRPYTFFADDKLRPSWGGGDSVLKWIARKYDVTFSGS